MSDILSAIGILLAIITLFYDKTTSTIKKVLEKPLPTKAQEIERKKLKYEICKALSISFIYCLIYFLFFWLLLPTSFNIILSSTFSFWSFDLSATIYMIINFTVLLFFIIAVKNTILLAAKWKSV